MKQTSRGLAPSLNTGHSTFTGARQRLAVALVAIFIAFAGAQTAGAQGPEPKPCKITFDISGEGTVEFRGETVTNGQTIDFHTPSDEVLTITPETGYVVSSVTYDAPDWLSIGLKQKDDFQWNLNINQYGGSKTPTIIVYIVFDKGLAGGADEASAVALTADDDLSHLTGGWYKVESDLTFGHTVNLHGDTHITIATGATLTISTSDQYGISGSALTVSGEGTLNVSASYRAINVYNYTQTGCTVTLSGSYYGLHAMNDVSISGGSLTTSGAGYGIDTDNGSITISGGTVSSSGDSAGLFATQAMNITGGTVNASSNNYGIRGYSVSITGGQVTASSGGIWSNYGDITLGCTSATDYITASGYVLQNDGFYVKIADGQKLYGGGFPSASFKGTVDDPSALNGLMLRPTAAVTKSGTNEYTIRYADGWDAFCDMLEAGETFNDKTIVLAGDIGTPEDPVTRMGSNTTQFQGTFDGQGHTLTVQYGTPSEPVNQQFVAPFPVVAGAATFRSLTIAGSIYSGYDTSVDKGTGGLIGHLFGGVTVEHCVSTVTVNAASDRAGGFVGLCEHAVTFTDCVSSAIVTCTGSGSGFVGWSRDSKYTIAFYGCLFSGKVLKQGNVGSGNGSFVGWKGFSKTVTITNCIAAPAADENMATDNSVTFCRYSADTSKDNGETHITNCYYTATLGNAQGKQAHSIKRGANVTTNGSYIGNSKDIIAHAGVATPYSVSGITAYKATDAHSASDPFIAGLLYNNVLYAGAEEAVSLTLGCTLPEGYVFNGYTVSPTEASLTGNDNDGYTLTMPNGNVTINATLTPIISYIDENGETQQCTDYIWLTGTETTLGTAGQETWYVADGTLNYGQTITISGNVHLILMDNAVMNVGTEESPINGHGIYDIGHSFSIYAQSTGESQGQLHLNASLNGYFGIKAENNGSITINGCEVEAIGTGGIYAENSSVNINSGKVTAFGSNGWGIIVENGNVTINGGQMSANNIVALDGSITINGGQVTANNIIANGSSVTINGGQVTANSIVAYVGNITLGWSNASDFIFASSYSVIEYGTLSIAEGKAFIDEAGNTFESSTIDASDINRKTLRPYSNSMLFLADDADNTAIISKFNGQQYNVTLAGRKLWKDGAWNTLVLPFAIADIEADGCPLKGATVRQLSKAYVTGTTLTLNFDAATTAIAAGVPYIVKWADGTEGEYTEAPVFQDVILSTDTHDYDTQPLTDPESDTYDATLLTDERVRFIGTYGQKTIATEDRSILFLGTGNNLYYPDGKGSGVTIGAFRAYFKIGDGEALARQLTAFNLSWSADGSSASGIAVVPPANDADGDVRAPGWYTLDGVKLDGKPTKKGLYIHGGVKVVIK